MDLELLFSMSGNSLEHLVGNGDFRSDECKALLEEADIVATNPPFCLFREYILQLDLHKKDFIILFQVLSIIQAFLDITDDVTIKTLNCKISFSNISSVFT
mgnify:CR=1 FL=1